MTLAIDISLKRPSRIYHEGETLSGTISLDSRSDIRHDGITLTVEGILSLQVSSKTAGFMDSLVSSSKPTYLMSNTVEIAKSGKLSAGKTRYPFEVPLIGKNKKLLYETYHGACIIIQYMLCCDVKRSLLAKDITKAQEFIVEWKPENSHKANFIKKEFVIRPETLQNVRDRTRVPNFLVKGHLNSTEWPVSKPVTGELIVCECERAINSIELQLVRLETCGSSEVNTREVSEIQNIQIANGDVCRGLSITIYMVLPRLFTCATVLAPNFRIEFELNIVITFDNDHIVMEKFPLKLTR